MSTSGPELPDWVAQPKRRISFRRRLLGALFWSALGFGVAVYLLDDDRSEDPPASVEIGGSASGVAEIVDCGAVLRRMAATIEVTNPGRRPADYLIQIAFESPDGSVQFDSAVSVISRLEPGQSAIDEVVAYGTDATEDFVCRIADEQSF
ncbi:MAG: hypothetical protein OSA99_06435 [Acidimicrobiales bacterium]|nr:hypothetical protein [Acidimicrobiales bacterium]